MENNKPSSNEKLISNQEEKLTPENCDSDSGAAARWSNKQLPLDLKIHKKKSSNLKPPRRVVVTINPRAPAIKTIFLAENSRFNSKKATDKSRSLAIGDHSSFNSHFAETFLREREKKQSANQELIKKSFDIDQVSNKHSKADLSLRIRNACKSELEPAEKCYAQIQPQIGLMHHPKPNYFKRVSSLIIAYSSTKKDRPTPITQLHKNTNLYDRKMRTRKMVSGANDLCHSQSSSDEEPNVMRNQSVSAQPGCSYIEHYSHIPETSAFQRYAQQSTTLSINKGTTIEKEHNSEQYGRDFTAYDGITARGRRQCVSATNKRDELPRHAAERMSKIRQKLNPVRDYKLMDTVHYLAQGEFAPRNDGIKLTPSREAVLSDIIWEDVCRTHWPSTRLGRRHAQHDRSNTRCELQRLIDNLLRERVAHVERRRRRHYRIVKLNHRHETSGGPVGKTDIIVASHKHKDDDDVGVVGNASGGMMSRQRWIDHHLLRSHRSHDRLMSLEDNQRRRVTHEECTPGPSYAVPRASRKREPTCCYQAVGSSTRPENTYIPNDFKAYSSSSTASSERHRNRTPRLVVKKESRKKHIKKEEVTLDHFILLPTLVVRTPSNVKRQKKFNELYHRILNNLRDVQKNATRNEQSDHHHHDDSPKNA